MTTLRVLEAGFRSTIQDAGRSHLLRSAVPLSGPADPTAFEAAQRLVGNTAEDAAIEVVGTPFRFTLDAPRLVALTGREVRLRTRGLVEGWTAVFARAGEEVVVEGTARTRFAYLAISGGIAVAPMLGSRATYLPAAIGPVPRPLQGGDDLPIGPPRWGADRAGRTAVRSSRSEVLVMPGPHADRFASPEVFFRGGTFRVSEASDRMGVRLEGPALSTDGREVLSLGVVAGAVQVPHAGEPVVLLADHQTTGGYPVIATVIRSDIGTVAQAAPGEQLSFNEVDRETALQAWREERRWLDAIA